MGEAYFHFYGELNDFLPRSKRQVSFTHYFKEQASIKDMIESLGVPHPEVDYIEVNEKLVDLKLSELSTRRSCSREVWDWYHTREENQPYPPLAMPCLLCSHEKTHKHGTTSARPPTLLLPCLQANIYWYLWHALLSTTAQAPRGSHDSPIALPRE